MPISETWLLPDGVADVLPEQAQVIETLRRQALDFLATRGYQLVYTPFIEYIESAFWSFAWCACRYDTTSGSY